MLRQVIAIGVLLSMSAGCSSAYIPQPGPRLSVVMENGSLAYVRDGKTYEGGLFGGEIEDAVSGNQRAEEYAHDYRNGMITGFGLSLLGIGGMIGGAAVGAEEANRQAPPVTGLVMIGAGLVLDLVGSFVILGSVPHLYDAVNAYNDGLGGTAQPPAPASGRRNATVPATPVETDAPAAPREGTLR
jgi:hypothetical protein